MSSKLCENKLKQRCDYIAGMLTGGFRTKNLSTKEVSKRSGIPQRTVEDRIQHPEGMRLKDLYSLADLAGVVITFEFKDAPE